MGPMTQDRSAPETGSDFAHRVLDIINDGALAVLMSIGFRTRLFDVLASHPPSSFADIARRAALSEQYVHDWLRGMVRGGIVVHHGEADTYELPTEHAACLCGPASPRNLAALAEYVPLLGAAEDRIVERFHGNGRTPYASRPSFRQLISKAARESDQAIVDALVETILPLVPGIPDALEAGITVLDIHCGSGRGVNLMASAYPQSRFYGFDPVQRHVDRANWRAFELGLPNVRFWLQDIAEFDERDRYDLITDFDTIRDQPRPLMLIQHVFRALKPGGLFLMQEVISSSQVDEDRGVPQDSILHAAGSLASWGERLGTLGNEHHLSTVLREVGFQNVVVHRQPNNICNCYFVATKGRG